jgi:hypothetical protein
LSGHNCGPDIFNNHHLANEPDPVAAPGTEAMVIGILGVPAPADERKKHILYKGYWRECEKP